MKMQEKNHVSLWETTRLYHTEGRAGLFSASHFFILGTEALSMAPATWEPWSAPKSDTGSKQNKSLTNLLLLAQNDG